MRNRWIVPSAVALLSLALMLLWGQMASQALIPPGDSEAAGPAGPTAPNSRSAVVHDVLLDDALGDARQSASVDDLSLVKTAEPARVQPGGVATYTLTFSNSSVTEVRTLEGVFDVLPEDVTFFTMTVASDIITHPFGSTGPIYWHVFPSIDPLAELTVQYVVTMPLVSDTVTLENYAYSYINSTMIGPASAEVKVGQTGMVFLPIALRDYSPPRFTVSKTAHPHTVFDIVPEAVFTYTVSFHNEGTAPGALEEIRDTLPVGFEFQRMVTDTSDIDVSPSGTTGEIVWTGPFAVPGESSLTLVYRVTSDPTIGAYTNSATATTVDGQGAPPKTPGQATVYISEPIYLEEDWTDPSPYWVPFLNYGNLNSEQWFVAAQGGIGYSPALKHDYDRGDSVAEDALYTYLAPGSEDWTDYRYEAEIRRMGQGLIGLWFRGNVIEPSSPGRHVEGYYLTYTTAGDWLRLSVICDYGYWAYHFACADPLEEVAYTFDPNDDWFTIAVEVKGDHFTVYVDDAFVFEAYDDTYPTGSVGMKTYRLREGAWDDISVTPVY